jgi:hypothetical protein
MMCEIFWELRRKKKEIIEGEQVYGRLETETDCSLFLFVLLITNKQKKERKKER